jgi:phosphoribosylpyrophosphate synthetase
MKVRGWAAMVPMMKCRLSAGIVRTVSRKRSGVSVLAMRSRHTAVLKSAYVAADLRPNVQTHYNSMRADVVSPAPEKLLLVDDIVTQGCTLLAAARRLAEAYPGTEIRAFASVRTMSGVGVEITVPYNREPCLGTITARGARAWRQP